MVASEELESLMKEKELLNREVELLNNRNNRLSKTNLEQQRMIMMLLKQYIDLVARVIDQRVTQKRNKNYEIMNRIFYLLTRPEATLEDVKIEIENYKKEQDAKDQNIEVVTISDDEPSQPIDLQEAQPQSSNATVTIEDSPLSFDDQAVAVPALAASDEVLNDYSRNDQSMSLDVIPTETAMFQENGKSSGDSHLIRNDMMTGTWHRVIISDGEDSQDFVDDQAYHPYESDHQSQDLFDNSALVEIGEDISDSMVHKMTEEEHLAYAIQLSLQFPENDAVESLSQLSIQEVEQPTSSSLVSSRQPPLLPAKSKSCDDLKNEVSIGINGRKRPSNENLNTLDDAPTPSRPRIENLPVRVTHQSRFHELPDFINHDAIINFPIHVSYEVGSGLNMVVAAHVSLTWKKWSNAKENVSPEIFNDINFSFESVQDFYDYRHDRNKLLNHQEYRRPEEFENSYFRQEHTLSHYFSRWYGVNLVIFHKVHGLLPAFASWSNQIKYPLLCIFDNGDRFYGVKSVESLFRIPPERKFCLTCAIFKNSAIVSQKHDCAACEKPYLRTNKDNWIHYKCGQPATKKDQMNEEKHKRRSV